MTISMEQIKKLRQETGAGVMDAKRALEDSDGDMAKAKEWIAKKGLARLEKKSDRETSQGTVGIYVHHDGKSASLVRLLCETDFVAKTDDFKHLAKELAMQVNSMMPESTDDLLAQAYVRDPKLSIKELLTATAAKLGENVQLASFSRVAI